jgi:hypothetical protein
LAISRPSKGSAGWELAKSWVNRHLVDHVLVLKIPDLDVRTSSSAQPIAVRAESKSLNDLFSIKSVKVLAFLEIPKHGLTVLTTRSAEGTIR